MSTTINPSSQQQKFFLMMRTYKIYFVNNFQICSTVLYTIDILLYITFPDLFYNWNFVPSDHLHPFRPPPPPTSGNHQSVLCIYDTDF